MGCWRLWWPGLFRLLTAFEQRVFSKYHCARVRPCYLIIFSVPWLCHHRLRWVILDILVITGPGLTAAAFRYWQDSTQTDLVSRSIGSM